MNRIIASVRNRLFAPVTRYIDRQYQDAQGRGVLSDPRSRATLSLLLEVMSDGKTDLSNSFGPLDNPDTKERLGQPDEMYAVYRIRSS